MSVLRLVAVLLSGWSFNALAAELSLTSVGLQTETVKVDGTKLGSVRLIQLGSRYGDLLGDDVHWFGHGELKLKSYDVPDNTPAPSDSTDLRLGGGLRYHMVKFSELVTPYLLAQGNFLNETSATLGSADETEKNGLYYGASFGFRFNLSDDFFAEVESLLFESALFSSEETTTGGATKVKTDRSKFELFARSNAPKTDFSVNIGMKF